MDLEGQEQNKQQQRCNDNDKEKLDHKNDASPFPVRRTILLVLFIIIIPCLLYYYLAKYIVPDIPLLQINYLSVERSGLPKEDTEVSKWYVNLTIHNPDKRWQGNFRDVRFKFIREDEEKRRVLFNKVIEPFSLGRSVGLQIILNMEEMDEMEEDDWEEESFTIRMYLKASFVDSQDTFADDYWEVRRECSNLRLQINQTKAVLRNNLPMWCEDRVRIVAHRHILWIPI